MSAWGLPAAALSFQLWVEPNGPTSFAEQGIDALGHISYQASSFRIPSQYGMQFSFAEAEMEI